MFQSILNELNVYRDATWQHLTNILYIIVFDDDDCVSNFVHKNPSDNS